MNLQHFFSRGLLACTLAFPAAIFAAIDSPEPGPGREIPSRQADGTRPSRARCEEPADGQRPMLNRGRRPGGPEPFADAEGRRPEGERPEGRRPPGRGPDEAGRPPRRPDPVLIRRLDTDGDGRLSKEEAARITELFDELDRNQDGRLDPHEILGPPPEGRGPRPPAHPPEGQEPRGDRPRRNHAN